MLDNRGFRLNVGMVLVNAENKVFWGKRARHKSAWQFPQGGIQAYETLEEAMYRELDEEVGLASSDVEVLKVTKKWVYYSVPQYVRRSKEDPQNAKYQGQKQRWFLLRLLSDPKKINFHSTSSPEFSEFVWVDYWYPMHHVVHFKQSVYYKVLREFEPILFPNNPK
ncbi:MAG: RNA pyrophosphohydrolase [Gammaproteobacteria bacterium]|jgi:putative (di)nucleoside polyphosphate hydrolase